MAKQKQAAATRQAVATAVEKARHEELGKSSARLLELRRDRDNVQQLLTQETEARQQLSATVFQLQVQADDQRRAHEHLTGENRSLRDQIRALTHASTTRSKAEHSDHVRASDSLQHLNALHLASVKQGYDAKITTLSRQLEEHASELARVKSQRNDFRLRYEHYKTRTADVESKLRAFQDETTRATEAAAKQAAEARARERATFPGSSPPG